MYIGALPACVSVHHICVVYEEARRGHSPSGATDSATMWLLKMESLSSEKATRV